MFRRFKFGAGLEEAGRLHTGPFRAFLRITLPLALPGILAGGLFVFLFSISDFSVVDYLSTIFPLKERVNAYTFEAFSAWQTNWETQAGRREAAALCMPVALLCMALVLAILRLLRKSRAVTVTSGHVRPRDIEEQSPFAMRVAIRGFGLLYCGSVLALAVGIPLGRTIAEAASPHGDLFGNVRKALVSTGEMAGGGLLDLQNSLLYAGAAALGMTVLATLLAHHAVRHGPRRESLVLLLSFLPLAFGPILFGVGLIRLWNHPVIDLVYDTWGVVVVMLVGKYLPFVLAAVSSSIKRIDPGYEEAGAVSGAGGLRRLRTIVSPLAMKGIAAGFVLGFIFSLRELDTMVLLSSGNRTAMMKIYTWVHTAYESNVAALSLVLMVLIALPLVLYLLVTSKRMKVF